MIKEILQAPHETLYKVSEPVTDFGAETQSLIEDMIDTTKEHAALGLAAVQLGELKRIIVAMDGKRDFVIINPEIVHHGKGVTNIGEACLSEVELGIIDVERYSLIVVDGLDRNGEPVRYRFGDVMTRIIQHEIDHLDGVLLEHKVKVVEDEQK